MKQIAVHVIDNIQELDQIRDDWNKLIKSCSENSSIFLTYEWISIRWQHFHSNCRLNIVVMVRDGNVIGIFPLMRKVRAIWLLKLEILETIGAVNGNYVGLFKNEDAKDVIAAFFSYIYDELIQNNTPIKLELIPDDCAFYRLLYSTLPQFSHRLSHDETTATIAPYIPIKSSWGEYYQALTRNRRKIIHKILNRSNTRHHIRYRQFAQSDLDTGLKRLFEIHQKRWQSVNIKSPFVYSDFREYYKNIAATFQNKDWLHFSYLTVDGEIRSTAFSYIYNDKFYAATIARDPACSALGLGHLHNYYLIQESFSRNLKEYDFLRGDEAYKFHWTKHFRRYNNIILAKYSILSNLHILYLKAFLRLAGIIQNKHSLKEAIALIRYSIKNKKLQKKMFLNSIIKNEKEQKH